MAEIGLVGGDDLRCRYETTCAFLGAVEKSPVLKVKYASMRHYCKGGDSAQCARRRAYAAHGRPADCLLPTGAIDHSLSNTSTRILVVDDIPVFRKLMEGIVSSVVDCAELVSASSAPEALRITAAQDIHLVVTDYNMPEMHGGDLVRELRGRTATAEVPIIVFTTETDESKRQQCLAHRRVRWVEKSPDREVMTAAIRELLVEGRD